MFCFLFLRLKHCNSFSRYNASLAYSEGRTSEERHFFRVIPTYGILLYTMISNYTRAILPNGDGRRPLYRVVGWVIIGRLRRCGMTSPKSSWLLIVRFLTALVVLSKVPMCSLHGYKALLRSLLAAIRWTVLTMLFGNHFAVVLDCFLKASTSSNLVPLFPNRWCWIFFTRTSFTEPFGCAIAYLLLLEANIPFPSFL